ncbi:hypothetical protein AURDEDRAFT_112147, partial [Auricularia subglabra TFB-10046 SS5]
MEEGDPPYSGLAHVTRWLAASFSARAVDARASRPSLPSLLRSCTMPLPYSARMRDDCGRPWRCWALSGDFEAIVLCVPSATMLCATLYFFTVYGGDYANPGTCTTARQTDTAMRRTTAAVRSG